MKIIFFGTAELACPSLIALATSVEFQVAAAVTQPDRPKGRNLKLQPPPVKISAALHGIPVLQPERARKQEFVEELARFAPDLIVVAAYGQILPSSILDLPRLGCLNVHTSLLPKYRGAAPIQWAILNGESETGVTIMKMDPGLDTGDILTQQSVPIEAEDNAQTLHDKLARTGAGLLMKTIPDYAAGRISPRQQLEHESSYARKITKEDGKLDWTQPASALWNRVRAFTPWPGAWTTLPHRVRQSLLKIWEAEVIAVAPGAPGQIIRADKAGIAVACGEHALRILKLQREGGRPLPVSEFLAGHPLHSGDHLG